MMPKTEMMELMKFCSALSVCMGAMAFWRRDGPKEDAVVAEAADVVLDSLADADKVSSIGSSTGKNLRDQLTIEEAIDLHKERQTRRWQNRN